MDSKSMVTEWTEAQTCVECGAEAAYLRHEETGSAICRECSHEHPMDAWTLDEQEAYVWRSLRAGSVARVLHVARFTDLGWMLRAA